MAAGPFSPRARSFRVAPGGLPCRRSQGVGFGLGAAVGDTKSSATLATRRPTAVLTSPRQKVSFTPRPYSYTGLTQGTGYSRSLT